MKKVILIPLLIFSICNYISIEAGLWDIFKRASDKVKTCGTKAQELGQNLKKGYDAAIKPCIPYVSAMTVVGLTHCLCQEIGLYSALSYAGKTAWELEDFPHGGVSIKLAGLFIVSYLYKCSTHYFELDTISTRLNDAKNHDLSWTVWQLNQWNTAKSMNDYKDLVENALKQEIKNKDNKEAVEKKIVEEKNELERLIIKVGAFSEFPEEFVQEVVQQLENNNNQLEYTDSVFDPATIQKKAIAAAIHLKDYEIKLDDDCMSNLVKQKNYNIITHAKNWLHPGTWTLAPCSRKARLLCAKLIRLYGRLCVLQEVVKGHKVEQSTLDKIAKVSKSGAQVKIEASIDKL